MGIGSCWSKAREPGGGKSDRVGKTDRVPAAAGSLFNLKKDLGETTNVAAQHLDKVRELTERMKTFVTALKAHSRHVGTLSAKAK